MQESSDTPLLDIVGNPNANATTRATFGQITVNGYMSADAGLGSSLKSQSGIIRFNLTEPGGAWLECRHMCGLVKRRSRHVRCDVLRRAERSDSDGRG